MTGPAAQITYDDFARVDIRAGTIIRAAITGATDTHLIGTTV